MSTCQHCQFFQIKMVTGPTPGDSLIGHCRRFPPTTGKPSPQMRRVEAADMSAFPMTRGSDWCGEFQPSTSPLRRLSATVLKKQPEPDRRLVVSANEAAKMLGVSGRHLHRMSAEAGLPRVQIGARVCYRVETLKNWLAEHERCIDT